MKKIFLILTAFMVVAILPVEAQKKKTKEVLNDSNTPLHLLQPDYKVPYGIPSTEAVKKDMDRVLNYLETVTPMRVVDKKTNRELTDYDHLTPSAHLERGDFRLASYEWGVTYSAMLAAFEATGDARYMKYVTDRFTFLAKVAPAFRKLMYETGEADAQMRQILDPHALDDAGAMCAAMIKAQLKDQSLDLKPLITNYINYILYKEYRLTDGTFARNRPQRNTLWLDDMFMGIPACAWMGRYASDNQNNYYSESVRQVLQFADRMFVPEKNLFRHGWVEEMQDHPSFHWGRANGWAVLTMCEVLDALPENYAGREKVLDLLRRHVRGLAACQGGDGFWHQLLDRNDSYVETSATAIYVYCIAHAINKGWIDAVAYGPVAHLGWNAVSTQINDRGQVENTCVGTGMGFDPAFYYYRPVNVYAAHGYGPVLWAGAEMINLLKRQHPKMNDSAVQYYGIEQTSVAPIFSVVDPERPTEINAGVSRRGNRPVLFLIGDSTMKNGRGRGDGAMWGWGSLFEQFFDTTRISVENHALGGRSSRTYLTGGQWSQVLPAIRKGDYLFVQFGHNDGGPINTGRARASLKGVGEDSQTVIMEKNGGPEEVFTFGHYLRQYVRQAKAKGATVVVLSHTPGNRWTGTRMNRCSDTYGQWSKEVAEQEGVYYIDLNEITAAKFDVMGETVAKNYFKDSVHTTLEGAVMNGQSAIEGLRQTDCPLKYYVK